MHAAPRRGLHILEPSANPRSSKASHSTAGASPRVSQSNHQPEPRCTTPRSPLRTSPAASSLRPSSPKRMAATSVASAPRPLRATPRRHPCAPCRHHYAAPPHALRRPRLAVSASSAEETSSASSSSSSRFYFNFTGFPFPLGPFLNRRTTRTEVEDNRTSACSSPNSSPHFACSPKSELLSECRR